MSILKPVSLERAVPLFRLARAISLLMFVLPVVVLFYQYKGLTTGDFFLIQGLFAFAVFALEVPTGYIGDLFSRKKVIVISLFAWCAGYFVWYLFRGFWGIFLGELFFGLGASLISGTGEAYVFDVLKKQGREKTYLKEWGRFQTWNVAGTTLATFAGGFLYDQIGPDAVVFLVVIATAMGAILSVFLPDIPDVRRVVAEDKSKWQDICEISKFAATHHEIKWLMLFPAIFGTGTLVMMWGLQPLMQNVGVPIALFGIFVGANQFFRMGFSHFAHDLFYKLHTKWFSLALFGVLVVGFLVAILLPIIGYMPLVYGLLVFVAFAAALQIAARIVTSSMINHRIKSDERATVLSVGSMFAKAFGGIVMIPLKFMIDGWNLSVTFAVMGSIILALTFIALVKLLRLRLA